MRPDNTDVVDTCWFTGEFCPRCENYLLATNGYLVWCVGDYCCYTYKPERAPLDSQNDDPDLEVRV